MKRRSAILTIATCAVAAVIGIPGAAHAKTISTVYVHKVGSTANAGSMTYYQNVSDDGEDEFTVWDHAADGHGVRGSLLSGGGTVLKTTYNSRGSGTYNYFLYDVARGKDYVLKVCLVDGESDTTPIKCASKVITG